MESQASLVGSEGGVELHAVSAVDLRLELVVFPDDAELDHALGDADDLEGGAVLGVLFEEGGVLEGGDELCFIASVTVRFAVFEYGSETHHCRPARTRAQKEG